MHCFCKYLIAIIFAVSFLACVHVPKNSPQELAAAHMATEKIAAQSNLRQRVAGLFYARAQGIKQFFGGVELDLIAQKPADLYIAPRSFFGSAAWVFASHGSESSWLIYDEKFNAQITKTNDSEKALTQLLGLPLKVEEIIAILLANIDLRPYTLVNTESDKRAEILVLSFTNNSDEKLELSVSSAHNSILELKHFTAKNELQYAVKYGNFASVAGIDFAHKWTIKTGPLYKNVELVLEAREIKVNEEAFPKESFYLSNDQ